MISNAGSIRSGGNNLGKSSALTPGIPMAAKEAKTLFTDGQKNEAPGSGVFPDVEVEVKNGGRGGGGALCSSMLLTSSTFSCRSRLPF